MSVIISSQKMNLDEFLHNLEENFNFSDDIIIDLLDVLIESVENFISLDTKIITEEIMKII